MDSFKEIVNYISNPTILFTTVVLVFPFIFPPSDWFEKWHRRLGLHHVWSTKFIIIAMLGLVAFFMYGLGDYNFQKIVLKPDNVPISGLIFLVVFFTWLAMNQAYKNDERLNAGEKPNEFYEAPNDKENGTVIISKKQTVGRGRMKRKWKSPTGGIWMSIIIHPKFDVSYTTLVPIATSLALCMAIEKILKIKPELKWPNDVTLKGKKVAGVLVDTSIISNEIENVVLGIGINFKIKPHELASTIKKTPNFYGVATLVKKNERALPLVHQFLYELENVFQLINSRRIKKIKSEWTKRSSTIGRNVSIITSEGNVNGKAIKIDSDGALIISKGKKAERILVGDITHDQ